MYNRSTILSSGIGAFWEQLVGWYQNSFVNDFLSYISERYYQVEFGAYEHLSFGAGANETAEMLILALAFGLIIASIAVAYTKKKLGGFVGKLLANECFSPESAMNLYELGYFRSSAIRKELSRGVTLRKIVSEVLTEEKEDTISETCDRYDSADSTSEENVSEFTEEKTSDVAKRDRKIDFIKARFYIPEELKYRAEIRFERKGSGWIPVLITAVGSLIGAALVCRFLPSFIGVLDNLIALMAPQ
jgi:hypothetical protein